MLMDLTRPADAALAIAALDPPLACGVSCGPRAYRVRVPMMRGAYSAAIGGIASELISAID